MRAPGVLIVTSRAAFADTAAGWIADRIEMAARARGSVSVALAGGSTPAPVYARLARLPIPWQRVHLFFGDERRVPPDDPASNFRLVRETLLDALDTPPSAVHRMRGEDADGDAAAATYEAELPPILDLVILGIGEDGHTASLFPGSAAVRERRRRVVAVEGPSGGPARLTLTPVALAAARERLVLVRGAGKAPVVREIFRTPPDPVRRPAQLVLDGTWILDDAAAAQLQEGA